VRSGNGPMILEMKTYRYRGHSMSDPAKYRTREEVQSIRDRKDPIDQFGKKLVDREIATEAALKAIDKEIRLIVNEAAEFAIEAPEPEGSELYTDVLA
jgi:pyruvate dehydrogenase E1 component alpha subunit